MDLCRQRRTTGSSFWTLASESGWPLRMRVICHVRWTTFRHSFCWLWQNGWTLHTKQCSLLPLLYPLYPHIRSSSQLVSSPGFGFWDGTALFLRHTNLEGHCHAGPICPISWLLGTLSETSATESNIGSEPHLPDIQTFSAWARKRAGWGTMPLRGPRDAAPQAS